jgi:hypothetical protein
MLGESQDVACGLVVVLSLGMIPPAFIPRRFLVFFWGAVGKGLSLLESREAAVLLVSFLAIQAGHKMISLPDPVQPIEQVFSAVNAKAPKEYDPSFLGLLGCRGLV